ncbi:ChbG/HpnK family deacetylase [Runella slithyformis]|uniref:ChbG/HpnK family deacetylase n=1 Tax=Runella slithyformis TaxID=106 RepID=UPI0002EF2365|nr:ChbG/HpnK family deacetylase [Runella slithyformis]
MRTLLPLLFLCGRLTFAQNPAEIRLIVRSDDIGFCHTANEACMKVYTDGISRSVEIPAIVPWFMKAVKMLKARPEYDVGVHLCLTAE